jgi:hypothetical protein
VTDPFNPYAPPRTAPSSSAEADAHPEHVVERPKRKWATVAAFGSDSGALAALKLLESAHIGCRVIQDAPAADTHILAMRSVPLGGHHVQVAPTDLVEAAKLLGVEVDPEQMTTEVINLRDERMKKALVVAYLGTFLCPGIAHLVSMALVLATPGILLTDVGRRRRRWAVLIDVAIFALIGFVFMTAK